jgi:hypothetical protein
VMMKRPSRAAGFLMAGFVHCAGLTAQNAFVPLFAAND